MKYVPDRRNVREHKLAFYAAANDPELKATAAAMFKRWTQLMTHPEVRPWLASTFGGKLLLHVHRLVMWGAFATGFAVLSVLAFAVFEWDVTLFLTSAALLIQYVFLNHLQFLLNVEIGARIMDLGEDLAAIPEVQP